MSDCELSPAGRAFSTFLTAFVGSIVNGFTNGALIAFITGWIAWLAVIRILAASLYEYWQSIQAGTNLTQYEAVPLTNHFKTDGTISGGQFANWMNRGIEQEVKATGWIGWGWSAIYTPISQSIWLAVNLTASEGDIKLARAIAIGVSALGLTFDNKQRYAVAIGRKWGSWAFVAFNFWNATACAVLGAESAVLLVWGARQLELQWFYYAVYVLFSFIWAGVSFKVLPIMNGSRRGVNIFVDIAIGAFAGLFVAAPALFLWQHASFDARVAKMVGDSSSDGLSLGAYLSCEGASGLSKFAAIMP